MTGELYFKKTVTTSEMTLFVALIVTDVVLLWVRLFHAVHANTLSIIAGVATVGAAWLLFRPELYLLEEGCLCVRRGLPRQELRIPYSSVTECDPIGRFLDFKRDADAAELLISYYVMMDGTMREKSVICHPESNLEFFQLLRERCPALRKKTMREIAAENEVLRTLSEISEGKK